MRRRWVVIALAATTAGCGSEKKEPAGAPAGPDRPEVRMSVEARPGTSNAWSQRANVRSGDELALRVRLRNNGREEAPDVSVRLRLPRGLRIERATASERSVEAPALGRPIDVDALLSGDGFQLGPLPGYEATTLNLATRVTRAGTVSATAADARDTLQIEVR
jgi:uncharacterized repeat protein (TIGR01451 family)